MKKHLLLISSLLLSACASENDNGYEEEAECGCEESSESLSVGDTSELEMWGAWGSFDITLQEASVTGEDTVQFDIDIENTHHDDMPVENVSSVVLKGSSLDGTLHPLPDEEDPSNLYNDIQYDVLSPGEASEYHVAFDVYPEEGEGLSLHFLFPSENSIEFKIQYDDFKEVK